MIDQLGTEVVAREICRMMSRYASNSACPQSTCQSPVSTIPSLRPIHCTQRSHLHLRLQPVSLAPHDKSHHIPSMVTQAPIHPLFDFTGCSQHTFTANFLCGKCIDFFLCFSVTRLASCLFNRLRIALVCFGRRSNGRYFLFL